MSLAQRWGGVAIDLYHQTEEHWPALRKVIEAYFAEHEHNSIERAWLVDAVQDMVRYRRRVVVATGVRADDGDALLDGALALRGRLDQPLRLSPQQVQAVLDLHTRVKLDTPAGLADAASLPEWIAERLLSECGPERAWLAAQGLNRPPEQVLRVNTLKASREEVEKRLRKEHAPTLPARWATQALRLSERTDVFALDTWREGWVEMQDEASQMVAELVAPPPGGRIVDYCAGAGGKMLAIAAAMNNRGRILACDIHKKRLLDLKKRARRAGVTNHQSVSLPAHPWPKEFSKADRVLVDAPCSGLGVLRRHPEARWHLQADDVPEFARKQSKILRDAWPHVAPGGRLIYATCSLLRAENEDVADAFARDHNDALPVLPREVLGAQRMAPLEDKSKRYVRTWPDLHECDGFFVALWRKKA